jgi:hypothetical protein
VRVMRVPACVCMDVFYPLQELQVLQSRIIMPLTWDFLLSVL